MDGQKSENGVYDINSLVVFITSVDFFFTWGERKVGAPERGGGGLKLRGNNQSLQGKNVTVVEALHQLIMCILSDVQPVKKDRCVRSGGGTFRHIEILHHERRAPE